MHPEHDLPMSSLSFLNNHVEPWSQLLQQHMWMQLLWLYQQVPGSFSQNNKWPKFHGRETNNQSESEQHDCK